MKKKQSRFSIILLFLSAILIIPPVSAKAGTGFLGVKVQDLSAPVKTALSIDHGILVTEVIDKSPAHKAGIKSGDILLEIQKNKIMNFHDLTYYVTKNSGKEISLKFKSQKKIRTVKIKLEDTGSTGSREWNYSCPGDRERIIMPFDFHHFDLDENRKLRKEIEELKENLKQLYKDLGKKYKESRKKKPGLKQKNLFQRHGDI